MQLAISGLCCLLAPWLMGANDALFYAWLVIWGITVAGDSPQFSTLTARNAPPQAVGSLLKLTNSLGFAISIASILLFVALTKRVAHQLVVVTPLRFQVLGNLSHFLGRGANRMASRRLGACARQCRPSDLAIAGFSCRGAHAIDCFINV